MTHQCAVCGTPLEGKADTFGPIHREMCWSCYSKRLEGPQEVTVMLAVNNGNGRKTGVVDAIEFLTDGEPLLALESEAGWKYRRGALMIHVGTIECRYRGYTEHVGNMTWDAATVSMADASALAFLRAWFAEPGYCWGEQRIDPKADGVICATLEENGLWKPTKST